MNAFLYHARCDLKAGVRDTSLMLMNYLFPLGFFFMAGLFMTQVNPFFSDIMIPGMVIFGVMTPALMNISTTMISEREAGIYRSCRVHNVSPASLITVPVIGALVHGAVLAAALTAAGSLVFSARVPIHWGWFILVWAVVSMNLATLGVLIGIASPSQRSGLLIAQGIYIPSVLLGGMMVPLDIIPENMQAVTSLLPASHGMRSFELLAMGTHALSWNTLLPLTVLAAGIIVNLVLAFMLFQWDAKPSGKKHTAAAALAFTPYIISVFL